MNDKSVLKSTWAAAFTVASVWFGTHVGGGFASGNQVIQYYSNYGYTSVIFPILAMGILAIVMYIMVKFAKLSGFDNYKDTYSALYPKPWMEVFFEIFYIIIVLAAIASAVAGAGEVLANFIGLNYVGSTKIIMNLIIVAVLIILTIFGIKLVRAASTVLSIAIIVITALLVVFGLAADYDSIAAQITSQHNLQLAEYTNDIGSAIWKGVLVYAGFQCVSIPPMIAASQDLSLKGIKKAHILGWLMNGLALAASGWMLTKWYPLLASMQTAGKEFLAAGSGSPSLHMQTHWASPTRPCLTSSASSGCLLHSASCCSAHSCPPASPSFTPSSSASRASSSPKPSRTTRFAAYSLQPSLSPSASASRCSA